MLKRLLLFYRTILRVSMHTFKQKNRKKLVLKISSAIFLGFIIILMGLLFWYNINTAPLNNKGEKISVIIKQGATPSQIASQLQSDKIIRSALAFRINARLNNVENKLQAGTYILSPAMNVQQITDYLVTGRVDSLSITFLPGATLAQNIKVLEKAGFSQTEIDKALKKDYKSPLFAGKPTDADLEGYIFGETYTFSKSTSVEEILETTFDQFYKVLSQNNLIKAYQDEGFTLFQAITLASIVQREASGGEEPQIAQVFLTRLQKDMPLGSDPTYQYIADKLGLKRSPLLDNPYNTRIYKGLPPGPIATPGLPALKAVANPADTTYLFFLHGDDDKAYFAHTFEEHEINIKKHCQVKCQLL